MTSDDNAKEIEVPHEHNFMEEKTPEGVLLIGPCLECGWPAGEAIIAANQEIHDLHKQLLDLRRERDEARRDSVFSQATIQIHLETIKKLNEAVDEARRERDELRNKFKFGGHDVEEFYREEKKPTYEELESSLAASQAEVERLKNLVDFQNLGQCLKCGICGAIKVSGDKNGCEISCVVCDRDNKITSLEASLSAARNIERFKIQVKTNWIGNRPESAELEFIRDKDGAWVRAEHLIEALSSTPPRSKDENVMQNNNDIYVALIECKHLIEADWGKGIIPESLTKALALFGSGGDAK